MELEIDFLSYEESVASRGYRLTSGDVFTIGIGEKEYIFKFYGNQLYEMIKTITRENGIDYPIYLETGKVFELDYVNTLVKGEK